MSEQEQKTLKKQREARERELDDFWDIDALIPPRRMPSYPANTSTTEVVIDSKAPSQKVSSSSTPKAEPIPQREEPLERHFIPPHTAAEETRVTPPDEEYEPVDSLIRRVRIFRWKNEYRYYEAFLRDAVRLYPVRGKESPRASFFSYVPQYSQMSIGQLEWYLWWRENLRAGTALPTDYSYLLLYAYELINLSDRIPPNEVRDSLFLLWSSYRETFHQLDSILPEWICDVGLIHRLPPPESALQSDLREAMRHCALREYYVKCNGVDVSVRALLSFCSNYDYRKSKFCTEDNLELFDRTVFGALQEVTSRFSGDGKLFSAVGMDDSKMIRDAYSGAICSYRLKRKIEVEYCSFSRSHELRFLITDVIKYTENRLRVYLGVRSRLTVYALPTAVSQILDEYLDRVVPKRSGNAAKHTKPQESAEYEKLYDLPSKPLSFSAAAEIEELSWNTTKRLVEAFEEESVAPSLPPSPIQTENEPLPPEPALEPVCGVRDEMLDYLAFLRAALQRDRAGQKQAAEQIGRLSEVIADEINGLAFDRYGDILLEEDGGLYTVIDDYTELAEELLRSADGKEKTD